MYKNHAVFANLPDTLLYMRINGMHQRRGGIRYAKCVIDFRMKMYRDQGHHIRRVPADDGSSGSGESDAEFAAAVLI